MRERERNKKRQNGSNGYNSQGWVGSKPGGRISHCFSSYVNREEEFEPVLIWDAVPSGKATYLVVQY